MELPHDISAETGVICSLILYPDFALECNTLKEGHFYDKKNGILYWAILNLVEKGVMKIDWQNISTQIKSDKERCQVMGKDVSDQIEEIVENAPLMARESVDEYKQVVNRVVGLGFKRKLYQEIGKIENKCLTDSTNDIGQINNEIMDTMNKIAIDYIADEEISNFGDNVDSIWNDIVSSRTKSGVVGTRVFLPSLNDFYTYEDGELVLYCARRKMGKSVIAMNELVNQVEQGEKVVYLDTEMSDKKFLERLLSHLTQIPVNDLKNGNYSPEKEELIKEKREWIKKHKFVHKYIPGWGQQQIITQCKLLHNQGRLTFLIYDYFKDQSGVVSSSELYNALGNLCDAIKNKILGALGIKGCAFAQLSRSFAIADSDKLERYVSTGVYWLEKEAEEIREDGEECGNFKMRVDFNRNGDSHGENEYIDCLFKKKTVSIEECKKQHNANKTPYDE